MSNVDLVLSAIENVIETIRLNYIKRENFLSELYEKSNNRVSPNIDRLGRFHSPVDGYQMPSTLDFLGDPEKLYRKGEYLPTPFYDEESEFNVINKSNSKRAQYDSFTDKIKVNEELAFNLIKATADNDYFSLSKGNSWDVNGTNVCYMYIKSDKKSSVRMLVEKIKTAIENKDVKVYSGVVVDGRQEISGRVISMGVNETIYGVVETMVVHTDVDTIVYMNAPSKVRINVGFEIKCKVTIKKGKKDHIGYGKRPVILHVG